MPTVNTFVSGDVIRFSVIFSLSGTDTDPTTITFRRKDPNKVVRSYVYATDTEIVRTAAGRYRIDLQLDLPGEWWVRWEGSGAIAAGAQEMRVRINRSNVLG